MMCINCENLNNRLNVELKIADSRWCKKIEKKLKQFKIIILIDDHKKVDLKVHPDFFFKYY